MLNPLVATLISVSIGASGGALFALLQLPLPWTLGSITASATAGVMGNRWPIPSAIRSVAWPVVGVLAGSAFTPEIFSQVGSWWKALVLSAVFPLATSTAGYFVFRKVVRLDPVTSYFAAAPGGVAELSLLGGSLGGRTPTLVLVHSTRIVTIVFAVPILLQIAYGSQASDPLAPAQEGAHEVTDWLLLIGAGLAGLLIGRFKWVPGGPMVAAMLCSGIMHAFGITDAKPPGWLVAFVQVLIGCLVGARFGDITWREARLDLVVALVWSAALLAAIAPGGSSEMVIISYALQADVAVVAFCQVARLLLVLGFAPVLFKLLSRRGVRNGGGRA
jgi:membrane AbrB-like protein